MPVLQRYGYILGSRNFRDVHSWVLSVWCLKKIMVHIFCSIIYPSRDKANLIFIVSSLLEPEVSKSDVPYNTSLYFEE